MRTSLGKHVILELYGCEFEVLNRDDVLIQAFKDAVGKARMTLLDISTHKFDPFGFTAVALLSESHMSIHTYPELGYAAVDVFTCGNEGDPFAAVEVLLEVIKPVRRNVIYIPRGLDIQTGDVNQDALNVINERKGIDYGGLGI